jgi:hydrogenase maturation protease
MLSRAEAGGARLAPLVIGIGNASRGDDGLGPALIEALEAAGSPAELMDVYQLQPEHALDLAHRPAVLIVDAVDASRPELAGPDGMLLARLQPGRDASWSSHALSPAALLQLCIDLHLDEPQATPPVWLLSIAAESFELGAGLTDAAQQRLQRAIQMAQHWQTEVCAAGLS